MGNYKNSIESTAAEIAASIKHHMNGLSTSWAEAVGRAVAEHLETRPRHFLIHTMAGGGGGGSGPTSVSASGAAVAKFGSGSSQREANGADLIGVGLANRLLAEGIAILPDTELHVVITSLINTLREAREQMDSALNTEREALAELAKVREELSKIRTVVDVQEGAGPEDIRAEIVRLKFNADKGLSHYENGRERGRKEAEEAHAHADKPLVLALEQQTATLKKFHDEIDRLTASRQLLIDNVCVTLGINSEPPAFATAHIQHAIGRMRADHQRETTALAREVDTKARNLQTSRDATDQALADIKRIGNVLGMGAATHINADQIIDEISRRNASYVKSIDSAKQVYKHDAKQTYRAVADMLGMPKGFHHPSEVGDYIKALKSRADNAQKLDEAFSAEQNAKQCLQSVAFRLANRIGDIAETFGLARGADPDVVLTWARKLQRGPYKDKAQCELFRHILINHVRGRVYDTFDRAQVIDMLVEAGNGRAHTALCACEPEGAVVRLVGGVICPVHQAEKWIATCR